MTQAMLSQRNIRFRFRGRVGGLVACLFGLLAGAMDVVAGTEPVTDRPWREAVISVTDPDVTARFFRGNWRL